MDVRLVVDPQTYDVVIGPPNAESSDALAVFRYKGQQTTVVTADAPCEGVRKKGWRHVAIEADLPFDTVGFFRRFADALAEAGVPILPFASFHFDHVLVPADRLEDAVKAMDAV